MSESPNSFIPKPQAQKVSRKPLCIAGGFLAVLLVVFLWGFFAPSGPKNAGEQAEFVENKNNKPLVHGENLQGLALPVAPEGPVAASQLPTENGETPQIVVVTTPKEDETLKRELEQLRRHNLQAHIQALSSPLVIKKNTQQRSADQSRVGDEARQRQAESGDNRYRETAYDVEADKDKEAFFARANTLDSDWLSPNVRTTGQRLELKTGTVIPGVMITGVNSDLPGVMIAQVKQSVFDSTTGRNLLIPQGSKLYGAYDSRVAYGQERVLIAWNRLIFPDGSALTLGAMPGADMAGYSGFNDEVNHHWMRIFGSATMMSVILGGTAYTMDSLDSSSGEETTMHGEMTAALASTFGQATAQILQKNLNIKPTIEIRPGYEFNIVLTQDLNFDEPYSPRTTY